MVRFSMLLPFFISYLPLASGSIDVSSLVEAIKQRTCQTALVATEREVVVVVGLGNYGYNGTRHNVGTELVDQIANLLSSTDYEIPEYWASYHAKDEADAEWTMDFTGASSPRREGLTVHYRIGGKYSLPPIDSEAGKIILVHPYYDINESGHVVAALVKEAGLRPEQIIVIVDDLMLAKNQIVLSVGKVDGSGDGHNGLKSINTHLGTGAYFRIRVGISNPKAENLKIDRNDWVLGQMEEAERAALFSKNKLENFVLLISNLQSRLGLDPKSTQKVIAQGADILKKLNKK